MLYFTISIAINRGLLAQVSDRKVSFHCPAEPVSQVLSELSQREGIHLWPSQATKNETLVISAKKANLPLVASLTNQSQPRLLDLSGKH